MSDPAPVGCQRCGHPFGVHEDGGPCEEWTGPTAAAPAERVRGCPCVGFLWVDPAGPSPTYGASSPQNLVSGP